jgi:hypothetical protein
VTQLDHAELLGAGPAAEASRAQAREIFERIGARPWAERASRERAAEVVA